MGDKAVQIIARGPAGEVDAAFAALQADLLLETAACASFPLDEARGIWQLDAWPADMAEARAIRRRLAAFAALAVVTEDLADADWLALSLSGLPPVRAGRFFVYGAHDRGAVPINAVDLRIEAGAAFGTGHHATTFLCLAALDAVLKKGHPLRVLDLGTGTGVLAIAAARTGARRVVGVDVDPIAVRVARENAALNGAAIDFAVADGPNHRQVRQNAPYDLVFANILAEPVTRLASPIARGLRRNGTAILSGMLASQRRAVLAAWRGQGFALEKTLVRDAWAALVMRRR